MCECGRCLTCVWCGTCEYCCTCMEENEAGEDEGYENDEAQY